MVKKRHNGYDGVKNHTIIFIFFGLPALSIWFKLFINLFFFKLKRRNQGNETTRLSNPETLVSHQQLPAYPVPHMIQVNINYTHYIIVFILTLSFTLAQLTNQNHFSYSQIFLKQRNRSSKLSRNNSKTLGNSSDITAFGT